MVNPVARLSLPTAQQAITQSGLTLADVWYRFFQALFNRAASTVAYLVETGITAVGTTQATATPLMAEWNEVSTTPLNSGVVLFNFAEGFDSVIFNQGANPLNIYPPIGCSIDALGANNPYVLAAGATRDFYQLSATQFRSR